MKVYRQLTEIEPGKGSAVTVGTFDGFHPGHLAILKALFEKAADSDLRRVLVTFHPHPRKVVGNPENPPKLLNSTDEKIAMAAEAGIDELLIIPFTKEFAAHSSEEFVRNILLEKLNVQQMIVGYDHHFGRNREGSFEALQGLAEKYGFHVQQVDAQEQGGEVFSSSLVRNLLSEGNIAEANRYLGYKYRLRGTVIRGDGRGKGIGFPTANMVIDDPDKLIPARGVYVVEVGVENVLYDGMMNIGVRPTFEYDFLTLEANLFNFNDNLYERAIEVRLHHFIREERKFNGVNELVEQLNKDKLECEKYFANWRTNNV
ncbi:MAG: bifunctional riboflavin kinase/FAD synthetase [Calditrichota bacterium]